MAIAEIHLPCMSIVSPLRSGIARFNCVTFLKKIHLQVYIFKIFKTISQEKFVRWNFGAPLPLTCINHSILPCSGTTGTVMKQRMEQRTMSKKQGMEDQTMNGRSSNEWKNEQRMEERTTDGRTNNECKNDHQMEERTTNAKTNSECKNELEERISTSPWNFNFNDNIRDVRNKQWAGCTVSFLDLDQMQW